MSDYPIVFHGESSGPFGPGDPHSTRPLGPNHRDGCDGANRRYSGDGYNRVLACACGAEDHAPDLAEFKLLREAFRQAARALHDLGRTLNVVGIFGWIERPKRKRRARYRRGREKVRPRLRGRR